MPVTLNTPLELFGQLGKRPARVDAEQVLDTLAPNARLRATHESLRCRVEHGNDELAIEFHDRIHRAADEPR